MELDSKQSLFILLGNKTKRIPKLTVDLLATTAMEEMHGLQTSQTGQRTLNEVL